MKKLVYLIPVLLLAVVCIALLNACAKPPDEAIMSAEDAIKAAAAAGADEASPTLMGKARGFLQEAKVLSEQKRYSDAGKKAGSAKIYAEKAGKYAQGPHNAKKGGAEGEGGEE